MQNKYKKTQKQACYCVLPDFVCACYLIVLGFGINEAWTETNPNLKEVPNLVFRVTARQPQASLKISLDDSGGYLMIENPFGIRSDTIRIRKWTVFHNCFPDTVKYWKGWFKANPSDTTKTLKTLRSKYWIGKITARNCETIYPERSVVMINDHEYLISIQESLQILCYQRNPLQIHSQSNS